MVKMKNFMILCVVLAAWFQTPCDARFGGLSKGLSNLGKKFLKRADPELMVSTASTLTSLYVGSTGIWFRSGIISAVNELEEGKKDEAMESLRIAIATLSVFDVTQATVRPIASNLINRMIKSKGFTNTIGAFKNYNNVLTKSMMEGGNTADDVIDAAVPMKEKIKKFFKKEVKSFLRNSQGYDDLVTSLRTAKTWAKAAKWVDVFSGPFFDAANTAFCGYQLHLAITDKSAAPEVRDLAIASGSLGVASGVTGLVTFAVTALATAGSTLAAVAGPIGGIIGCLLSLAGIIIDLINSYNPYGEIKSRIDTLNKLREGSIKYLENNVKITKNFDQDRLNTGFDTIYEVNQAALIAFKGTKDKKKLIGYTGLKNKDSRLKFSATSPYDTSDGYLVQGKQRYFDKSVFRNALFKPSGRVSIGYEFYGKSPASTNGPNHKPGITVRVSTGMVAENFWLRGVEIDTTVANDESRPDNVIIGEMTSLSDSDAYIRVWTGAGDDLMQITGIFCNSFTIYGGNCIGADLGSGIDTLSFQGMTTNPYRLKFPVNFVNSDINKTVTGLRFRMFPSNTDLNPGAVFFTFKDYPEKQVGVILNVNVFHGSHFNDVVEMGDHRNYIARQTTGRNKYIIHLANRKELPFTHTIEDDSDEPATISFNLDNYNHRRYGGILKKEDLRYSIEANTLIIYMKYRAGKVILKRRQGDHLKHFKINIPSGRYSRQWEGDLESIKDQDIGTHDGKDTLVFGVPYKYFMDKRFEVYKAGKQQCGVHYLELHVPSMEPTSSQSHTLEFMFPNSHVVISEELTVKLENEDFELYFLPKDRNRGNQNHRLVLEKRRGNSLVYKITMKTGYSFLMRRILFGHMGSHQLAVDLEHDRNKHSCFNIYEEIRSLEERPEKSYRFITDYADTEDKAKSIVLGAPVAEKTSKTWTMDLGLNVDSDEECVRNALIVNDGIYESINTDENGKFKIEFTPKDDDRKKWIVEVKDIYGDLLHKVEIKGADMLVYEQQLARKTLKNLSRRWSRKKFDLFEVMKSEPAKLAAPPRISGTYVCKNKNAYIVT